MFIEYTQLILDRYEEKRADGTLSPRLMHPTPARLKEECEAVFSKKYDPKDKGILSVFFGETSEGEVGLRAIRKCDIDKFRPLVNFLLKKTQKPVEKNIELLAWLIDFKERPFKYGKRYGIETIKSGIDDGYKQVDKVAHTEKPTIQPPSFGEYEKQSLAISPQTSQKKRFTSTIQTGIVVIILAVAGVATYSLKKDNQEPLGLLNLKPAETCMYWLGDHYEQTSCTQKRGDTLVVALDTLVLRYLRKINTPDTITLNAIGRVWYIKTNKQIECYTSGGNYPPDPKRKLRPITKLIIQNYIHPGN